jgi:hypothetical protein
LRTVALDTAFTAKRAADLAVNAAAAVTPVAPVAIAANDAQPGSPTG